MSGLYIFSSFVLFLEIAVALVLWALAASWPGSVAVKRNHPQADAIKVGGWVTAICLWVLWPVVLIWAYTTPKEPENADELHKLQQDNKALRAQLELATK